MDNPCKANSKGAKFWNLAYEKFNLTEDGYSDWITYEDWEKIGLSTSNGCQWLHKGDKLTNTYEFDRIYGPITEILSTGEIIVRHNKLKKVRFIGLKNIGKENQVFYLELMEMIWN